MLCTMSLRKVLVVICKFTQEHNSTFKVFLSSQSTTMQGHLKDVIVLYYFTKWQWYEEKGHIYLYMELENIFLFCEIMEQIIYIDASNSANLRPRVINKPDQIQYNAILVFFWPLSAVKVESQ